MEKIEDLSYSNLVNLIQNDTTKAGDVLYTCAKELEIVNSQIKEAEEFLLNLKKRQAMLKDSPEMVLKHISKKIPLIVQRKDCAVCIAEDIFFIEYNVI